MPYPMVPQPERAPEGTNPSTTHFWLIVIISGVLCIPSFVWLATLDFSDMIVNSMNYNDPLAMYAFLFTPGYFAILAISVIGYAATVALAYADSRALASRGVPRPFAWATAFVPTYGTYIYVIGRSVVVKRRTGDGLAPLWVFIAIQVAVFIISIVLSFAMMFSMFSEITQLAPSYR